MSSTHPAGKAPQDTGGEQSAGWLPGARGALPTSPAVFQQWPSVTVTQGPQLS